MIYFMQVKLGIVLLKGYGTRCPEGSYAISKEQYSQKIGGAIVNSLPTYNEDGTVLTDAGLTLIEEE
ncbi:MAG: hypothetical protein GY787_31735 [Alteromonadales bacterium]|nr:hypothetical protein [Alteromonadales bacterium]